MLTFLDKQGAEGRLAPLGRIVPAFSNPHRRQIAGFSRRYTGPNGTCQESNSHLFFFVAWKNLPLLSNLKCHPSSRANVADDVSFYWLPRALAISLRRLGTRSSIWSFIAFWAWREVAKSLSTAKSRPGNHGLASTCTVAQCTDTHRCKLDCHFRSHPSPSPPSPPTPRTIKKNIEKTSYNLLRASLALWFSSIFVLWFARILFHFLP